MELTQASILLNNVMIESTITLRSSMSETKFSENILKQLRTKLILRWGFRLTLVVPFRVVRFKLAHLKRLFLLKPGSIGTRHSFEWPAIDCIARKAKHAVR